MQALKKLGLPTDIPVRVLLSETFNSNLYNFSEDQKQMVGILRDVVANYNRAVPRQTRITSSRDAADAVRTRMIGLDHEQTWGIFLNADNSTIEQSMICQGSLDFTPIDTRRIIAKALALNAKSFILIHNHPSGNPMPSNADIKGTEKLRDAGKLMDIAILDHLIISDGKYYSFADEEVSVL